MPYMNVCYEMNLQFTSIWCMTWVSIRCRTGRGSRKPFESACKNARSLEYPVLQTPAIEKAGRIFVHANKSGTVDPANFPQKIVSPGSSGSVFQILSRAGESIASLVLVNSIARWASDAFSERASMSICISGAK